MIRRVVGRSLIGTRLIRIVGNMTSQAPPGHLLGDRHLAAALPHVAGDYMGEHWLASFALLALTA